MTQPRVQRVVQAIRSRAYRLTEHAEREREADAILVAELEEAFGSDTVEMLEDYPSDPRGQSALFLGFTRDGNPLHAIIGLSSPDIIAFVTLYRPDPRLWNDCRKRRERS